MKLENSGSKEDNSIPKLVYQVIEIIEEIPYHRTSYVLIEVAQGASGYRFSLNSCPPIGKKYAHSPIEGAVYLGTGEQLHSALCDLVKDQIVSAAVLQLFFNNLTSCHESAQSAQLYVLYVYVLPYDLLTSMICTVWTKNLF